MAAAALHNKLLTDISDELDIESSEYQSFVFHMTQFVPKGLLNKKPNLLAKFDAMKNKGKLDIGHYDSIMKVAELSGNIEIRNMISERKQEIIEALGREKRGQQSVSPVSSQVKERKQEIIEAVGREKKGQQSDLSVSAQVKGTDTIVAKKRKLEEETDQSDPLYGVDASGKGKYDTAGKRGYLLILNNTYNRSGTINDVTNLESFFGGELNFEVNTISDYLSKESFMNALRSAREKLNNDTIRLYYVFVCAILTHGSETGLSCKDNGVIKVDDIRKLFCENMKHFAGRPKLFFIQSCRGSKAQVLHHVDDADDLNADDIVDEADEIICIPSDADTLMARSNTKGYASYRDMSSPKTRGAYFINALHEIFSTSYRTDHVEDMLISVREKIALAKEEVYDAEENTCTKQMPCTLSTLTKRLYLTPYRQ